MIAKDFKYPVLMNYFEKISSIPRGSYHEEQIADYLVQFAKERGLEYYRDSANNVLINIPASHTCEDKDAILLQGHTDMVCEKNADVTHDFLRDGLKLYVEDGYLRARGTTLGADDGVAVAVMLSLLDGDMESHPALQCLFTASEEVGLDGAKSFDYSRIFARKMINMDGADEIYLIVGCAGGVRSNVYLDSERVRASCHSVVKISLGGLIGGHSGENIGDGRANANKLAGELLGILDRKIKIELISIDGGTKENAIPRETVIQLATDDPEAVIREVLKFETDTAPRLGKEDSGFYVSCEMQSATDEARVFPREYTSKLIGFINSLDNGVLKMSERISGLVEFSRNLGIASTKESGIELCISSRSAIEEQLDSSISDIDNAARLCGGRTLHYNRYPGWEVSGESELADRYIDAAERLFGLKVVKMALHAGLECGIIKQAVPDMEIISCGPDVKDLHSPMESLDLESFERFFSIIKDVIGK